MFSSLDILYIVLAFCVLWFTAALFWLIWQAASVIRNVNLTLSDAREKMGKIEEAITAIRHKFDGIPSTIAIAAEGLKKVVEFAMDRRKEKKEKK